jgi:hexosaminidase
MKLRYFCLLLLMTMKANAALPVQSTAITPRPCKLEIGEGTFVFSARTTVILPVSHDAFDFTADYLRKHLAAASGYALKSAPRRPSTNVVVFSADSGLGREAYTLRVTPQRIDITSGDPAGAFYAVQTLLQLLPPEVFSTGRVKGVHWTVPCVTIEDHPRYTWRGMHLDCARHFFPVEFVKRYIDEIAFHKLNTFHWHLTDDQGWRIEIPRYPALTSISAWRVDREDRNWNVRPDQRPGEKATYGGFYTQAQIKEVIAYAAERFITVVPEIEMPAHATAVLAAYPNLSCTGGPFTVLPGGVWPIKDIFCAGNDTTFAVLQDILTEVAALFPGPYIHIGGDEANKTEWQRCPKCQARIKAEGLHNETELQSYFTKRIEKFLGTLHKRLIGWDEILEGGIAPEATVMSWRGINGGIAAARARHDVIMSPTSNCYFDYYQGDPSLEPMAIGGYLPLTNVYAFEPTPDSLTTEEAQHILGVQANLWTEFIPTPAQAQYMVLPRMDALCEIAWTPKELKSWQDFSARLPMQFRRYEERKSPFARSAFNVSVKDSFDVASGARIVGLTSECGADQIRYTLNGKTPTTLSPLYTEPLRISTSAQLRAANFSVPGFKAPVTALYLPVNRKGIVSVTLASPPDRMPDSSMGLVDNLLGQPRPNDLRWKAFRGKPFEAVIDLGSVTSVKRVLARFLHETIFLSFLPPSVTLAVSEDGNVYKTVATVHQDSPLREMRPFIKEYELAAKSAKARYLKLTADNAGLSPDWHKFAGQPTWLLIDEIIVE